MMCLASRNEYEAYDRQYVQPRIPTCSRPSFPAAEWSDIAHGEVAVTVGLAPVPGTGIHRLVGKCCPNGVIRGVSMSWGIEVMTIDLIQDLAASLGYGHPMPRDPASLHLGRLIC